MTEATTMEERWIPLFPLQTVLFPDGPLRLQIFEPRYLDMISECARENKEFGVCLIVEDDQTPDETRTTTARIGTAARIVDFFTTEKGLLGIQAQGTYRFELLETDVRDNGLAIGRIRKWPPEPGVPIDPQYGLLSTILERLLEQVEELYPQPENQLLDDASWVGCRLAELLPLEPLQKQVLLECREPESRLEELTRYLPDLQQG